MKQQHVGAACVTACARPRRGAWMKRADHDPRGAPPTVAPARGAWIETVSAEVYIDGKSRPARGA